jgi:hypothetical protein
MNQGAFAIFVPLGSPSNHDLPSNTLPEGIFESPRFQLPKRSYLLTQGPIKEALHIGFYQGDDFSLESPNLIWPEDKSWIVVSEIDFCATLIGGSLELIQKIMQKKELTSEIFNRTDTAIDLGLEEF